MNLTYKADNESIFRVLVKFVPEGAPLPDEMEAIKEVNESINLYRTNLAALTENALFIL